LNYDLNDHVTLSTNLYGALLVFGPEKRGSEFFFLFCFVSCFSVKQHWGRLSLFSLCLIIFITYTHSSFVQSPCSTLHSLSHFSHPPECAEYIVLREVRHQ